MGADRDKLHTCLRNAATRDDLNDVADLICAHYRIDNCFYYWVNAVGERYSVGNFPDAWLARYREKEYCRMDPVLFNCYQTVAPVNWSDIDWSARPAAQFREDAIAHGMAREGLSIPLHGPQGQFAVFSVCQHCDEVAWRTVIAQYEQEFLLLAHDFNRRVLEIDPSWSEAGTPPLSPREIEALRCLAQGHSRAQAALQIGISEHTLRVYIESARHKLGASNTIHAVARALSNGIIII